MQLTQQQILELELKANQVRQLIIPTLVEAGSGHTAGPLGMADIFTAFYFHILKQDPKNPLWDERDRFVLSNGHICPLQYVCLAMAGYFPVDELKTLRKINSRLQGHPHRGTLPGVETTSGPLGEGLSQGIGMAIAAKMDNKPHRIYVATSDGEHQEGNTWEAAMLAGKLKLDNLIQVIDYNDIQIDGFVKDIMPEESMKAKYEAFNWHTFEIPGNDIKLFIETVEQAKQVKDKPVVIIARTVPGKGISFMENDYRWHGMPPDLQDTPGAPKKGEQAAAALEELKKTEEELKVKLSQEADA